LGNDVYVVNTEINLFVYDLGEAERFGEVEPGVIDETFGWVILLYILSVFGIARRRE
jgi:hypothetical protein